jgi:hypothetical protein
MEYVIKRGFLTVLLVLFGISALPAQGVQFSTDVSNTEVGVQEPFRITFTINNASRISDFQPPAFRGFEVLSQQQSQATSFNGTRRTQRVSFVYILQATAPGRFTIAGATARINGNTVRSNPVTITVEKGATSGGSASPSSPPQPANPNPFGYSAPDRESQDQPSILRNGEDPMAKIKKNLFVRVDVDKTDVYVGEQITATYKLYTRLVTTSQVTKVPSFTGFSAHDQKIANPPQASIEHINGVPFRVFTIRKTMLFPLQSGDLTLDPVEVDNQVRLYQVHRRQGRSLSDIFNDPFFQDPFGSDPFSDPFFQDAFGGSQVTSHDYDYPISSKPVRIHVKPLPTEGKPEDFGGAVGNFTLTASLDKHTLSTDDAATLTVTVSGQGNITLLNAPQVHFPPDFESYDPKVTDKIGRGNPFGGSRTFTYVIMPKATGHFTLPSVSLSYFDPSKEAYETVSTSSFSLEVTPGKNPPEQGTDYSVNNNRLSPIHTGDIVWHRNQGLWIASWPYWALIALPLCLLAALLLFKRRRDSLYANQTLLKNKRANRVALKRLSQADRYLKQHDHKAFYGEVSQAVWGYLCDKLNIPFAELSKQRAQDKLLEQKVNGQTPEKLFALLDHCEMALYAGFKGDAQMKETYDDAMQVIMELEQKLKK